MTQLHLDRFTLCRPIRKSKDGTVLHGQYRHFGMLLDITCGVLSATDAVLDIRPVDRRVKWPAEAATVHLQSIPGQSELVGEWTDGTRNYLLRGLIRDPIVDLADDGGKRSYHYYLVVSLERVRQRVAA